MADDPSALRAALRRLEDALADARVRLGAEARPPAAVLDGLGVRAAEARDALLRLTEAAGSLPEAERLDCLKEASAARERLAVVAKLAGGAAWFHAVVRELDGRAPGGLYGRAGAVAWGGAGATVERKL
ncbi:MAG: hypothetical protein AAB152_07075 [Candidatus Coatesbacteria bacterium]